MINEKYDLEEALIRAPQVVSPPSDDLFFAGQSDVLAVFDFDYETIISFNTAFAYASGCFSFLFTWLCCIPCFVKPN